MLGGVRPAVQDPVGVGHVQHPHAVQRQKECHARQCPGQCKGIAVRSTAYRTDRPACRSRMRRIHRSKVVDMVVDQLSPCFRLTAQGRFSHSSGPFSSPGRLCTASMQTKRGGPVRLRPDQHIGVALDVELTRRPVSFSTMASDLLRRLTCSGCRWQQLLRQRDAPGVAGQVIVMGAVEQAVGPRADAQRLSSSSKRNS